MAKKVNAKQKAQKAKADKARRDAKKNAASEEAAAPPAQEPAVVVEDAKPKKGLKALREHNDERAAYWRSPAAIESRRNGIACPTCGEELLDKHPVKIRLGDPPRVEVCCSVDDCHWHGVRVG